MQLSEPPIRIKGGTASTSSRGIDIDCKLAEESKFGHKVDSVMVRTFRIWRADGMIEDIPNVRGFLIEIDHPLLR